MNMEWMRIVNVSKLGKLGNVCKVMLRKVENNVDGRE
jgi:hypothetical protein